VCAPSSAREPVTERYRACGVGYVQGASSGSQVRRPTTNKHPDLHVVAGQGACCRPRATRPRRVRAGVWQMRWRPQWPVRRGGRGGR
jgi:hypothetical protein